MVYTGHLLLRVEKILGPMSNFYEITMKGRPLCFIWAWLLWKSAFANWAGVAIFSLLFCCLPGATIVIVNKFSALPRYWFMILWLEKTHGLWDFFFNMPIGVSVLLTSPAPTLGQLKWKETPGDLPFIFPQTPLPLAGLPPFLYILESSCVSFMYHFQDFLLFLVGGVEKVTATQSFQSRSPIIFRITKLSELTFLWDSWLTIKHHWKVLLIRVISFPKVLWI